MVGQRTNDAAGARMEPAAGRAPSRAEDTTALVLSRAVHLIDAAVQHLQACLEQDPTGDTTAQVQDLIGALHEVQTLAEALPARREATRPPHRTDAIRRSGIAGTGPRS